MSSGMAFLARIVGILVLAFGVICVLIFLEGRRHAMEGFIYGVLSLTAGVYLFRRPNVNRMAKEKEIAEKLKVSEADYSHVFKDTGISLNKNKSTLSLYSGKDFKTYEFDKIRSWRYSFLEGGTVHGGGLSGVGANAGKHIKNSLDSGFFVETKDIDYPEWHIRFKYDSSTEREMKKCMEILRQNINNDV
jgi:hypothetical protein